MTPVLTEQQQADAAHVESLIPSGRRLRLDFSDERQYRHAVDMHILGGQTPDRYPGLHQGLADAREAHIAAGGPPPLDAADNEGFETGAVVTSVATLEGTNTTGSEGFSSVLGGAYWLANTLVVKDQSANVLAAGSDSQFMDGTYLEVATEPNGAQPVASSMIATLQSSYQLAQGEPPVTDVVQRTVQLVPMADPVVEQPVKSSKTSAYPNLRIGLGRGDGNTGEKEDVDYWFWQTTSNTTYAVPLVGHVDFNGTVTSVASVFGYLSRGESTPAPDPGPKGGILEISPAEIQKIKGACQPSGSRLSWTLPAPTSATEPGNPIVFVPAPWDTSEATFLFIQFTVNLEGQQLPAVATILSSKEKDSDPLDGTAKIPPIEFVFHCLAAGTQIVLADGSTAAIEVLTKQHAVRGGDGQARDVVSTVVGNHDGPVMRLTVDGERELLLSHNHLVLTPDGPRAAGELKAGDAVCVEAGSAPLSAVAEEHFSGLLCNASLSLPNVPADPDRNALLANGILVCDYELQIQTHRAHREDPDWVLEHLDPMYHQDYRNHLADRVAAARG